MQRRFVYIMAILGSCSVIALNACSDSSPDTDAGNTPRTDGALTDAAVDATPLIQNIGEGCEGSGACEPGSPTCYILDPTTSRGICTRSCTPDAPSTPSYSEDDCSLGSACAYLDNDEYYCLKSCAPSLTENTCPESSGLACAPSSVLWLPTGRRAVCLFPKCTSGNDCPVSTATHCEGDENCSSLGSDASCDLETNRCTLPGNCTPGGICGAHEHGNANAAVGDPCESDLDCPNEGYCFEETLNEETGSALPPHGYCVITRCAFSSSLPDFECPPGSTCYYEPWVGGCYKDCSLDSAESCRGNTTGENSDKAADYECYDLSGYATDDGIPLAERPICITPISCNLVDTTHGCAGLAADENPTHMRCRDPQTGDDKTDPNDKTGMCLDDTASGEFGAPSEPTLDGGIDDAGTDDGGIDDAGTDVG